ncbi:kinase-like domain-containing protein [Syncephalis plumigaleata]|nr:kinase-like domain-containing protein [Syncephalis plumigaleata]
MSSSLVENQDSPAAMNLNSADTPTATEGDDREEGELEPGECLPTDDYPKPPSGAPPPPPPPPAPIDDGHLSGTRSSGHYSDRRYNSMARSLSEVDRDRDSHGRARYHNNNDYNAHRYNNNNSSSNNNNNSNNTNGGHHSRLVSPHGYMSASSSAPRSGHRTMGTGGNYGESRSEQRIRPMTTTKRTAADLDSGTGGSGKRSDGKRARHLQESAIMRDGELIDARVQEARNKAHNVRKPKTKFGNISLSGAFSIDDFDFTESNRVGAGTFGVVLQGRNKKTGEEVALKRIIIDRDNGINRPDLPITAIREIKILKSLKHKNVIELLGMAIVRGDRMKNEKSIYYMAFPYMQSDLAGVLANENFILMQQDVKILMKQLLEGLAYIHCNNIIHRDIKTANILISNKGVLKIADLGLARPVDPDEHQRRYTMSVVTRWYRAPELFLGDDQYTRAIDIWSVGCVFGEMMIREALMPGITDADQLTKIWNYRGTPDQILEQRWQHLNGWKSAKPQTEIQPQMRKSIEKLIIERNRAAGTGINTAKWRVPQEDAFELLEQLLALDPSKRVTAMDALCLPYFINERGSLDPSSLQPLPAVHEIDKERAKKEKAAARR